MSTRRPTARRVALVVLGAGLLVFVAVAALRVPWHPYPGGPLDVPAPRQVFTARQLAGMEDYSATARLWSRTSLAVSLLVSCLLGLTPLGRRLMARLRGPWWLRVVEGVVALLLTTPGRRRGLVVAGTVLTVATVVTGVLALP